MEWIRNYQLVLLDLDGLLVNTEELHYQAYITMCANRGYKLKITFPEYCEIAHRSAEGLEALVYSQFPDLKIKEPQWSVLYAEKKKAYTNLITQGAVHLMPGVEHFLKELERAKIKRAVVTHSAHDLVNIIRRKNPVLDTIPNWYTRENYRHPKPHPECYQKAINDLAAPGDKIIGFEDSPRGLEALAGTDAKRVFICSKDSSCYSPDIPGVIHFESLAALPEQVGKGL